MKALAGPQLIQLKFFLWSFGHFKVPLIGYLKPRLLMIDEEKLLIKLRLNRRSKNHLQSMYFGALAVGADLAGGLYGYYYAKKYQVNISLAFKSFQAQFLRRPESDVFFVCKMGKEVNDMVLESQKTKQRVNKPIHVLAYTNYPHNPEEVAQFILELSLKAL